MSTAPRGPGGADETWRAVRVRLARARVRQGVARVRVSVVSILVASAAAGLAYTIAHWPLGHPYPFFAPVAAWVCLGFTPDRQPRKVLELAIGVAIGVGLGDAVTHVIGSGAWQVSIVLFASALVARFVDRGTMLTTQAGVQSIVIVLLPPTPGAPLGRFTDALVGGGVALAVAALSPHDPRRKLATLGRQALGELAEALDLLARGLVQGDAATARRALLRGRASEPAFEDWREAAASARDLARVNARGHRLLPDVERSGEQAVLADRVMRTVRVLARRVAALTPGEHATAAFGEVVARAAAAVRDLAAAVEQQHDPARAREGLLDAAGRLDPHTLAPGDWEVQALVLLARSVVVDALEAAGEDPAAARDALPEM